MHYLKLSGLVRRGTHAPSTGNDDNPATTNPVDGGSIPVPVGALAANEFIVTGVRAQALARALGVQSGASRPKRPGPRDLGRLASNMATMLGANISITDTLKSCAKGANNKMLKAALKSVRNTSDRGMPLYEAMELHPQVFDQTFVALTQTAITGADSVRQREIYLDLKHSYDMIHRITAKVKGELVTPVITLLVGIGVGVIVLIYVIPALLETLTSLSSGELPFATRLLIGISTFITSVWFVVAMGALLAGLAYVINWRRTKEGRIKTDPILIKIPVVGTIIQKGALARMCRTLAVLLNSGIPKQEAIAISAKAANNTVIECIMADVQRQVELGNPMHPTLLRHEKIITSTVVTMIEAGEEANQLDIQLVHIAGHYQEELEEAAENVSKLIGPIMILFIGAFVLLILLAVFTPISEITGTIGNTQQ